jgi:hypothetical protein
MMALVGCTLTQSELRKGATTAQPNGGASGAAGQLITPKRCTLRVALLSRPVGDATLGEVIWREADAQAVDDAARRAWEGNGLRLGRIVGELPGEVLAMMDEKAKTPDKVAPTLFAVGDGEKALVDLGPATASISVFINRGDQAPIGKVYRDAKPYLRMVPTYDESGGVALRLVPEVHHGQVRQGWTPAPANPFEAQRFVVKHGQDEDTFRELAATLVLKPGQVAIVGGRPGQGGSLGDFLFTEPEGTSDRPLQKVVLIWAERTDPKSFADPGSGATPKLEPADPPEMPGRGAEAKAATPRR